MKVGFIGLGTMGASMASNLQAGGHELQVSDVRKEAAAPHLKAGAIWKDTPRQVAEGVEAVFTSLPGPKEVEQVALGPDGLIHGMKKGSAYFDLSTNSPALMRRLYPAFKEKGIHVLDAPVSGGPKGAKSRKLALWIGGDREVYDRFKPVLDAIGDQPYYVGPIGAGSVAKLVHNCAGYAVQTALAEVFTMGVKGGVDALTLWKAVRQGAGGRRRTFDGLADQFLPGAPGFFSDSSVSNGTKRRKSWQTGKSAQHSTASLPAPPASSCCVSRSPRLVCAWHCAISRSSTAARQGSYSRPPTSSSSSIAASPERRGT